MIVKTANVGGIDEIKHHQSVDLMVCSQPIADMSNRKASKWYKTHHNSDLIWVDGTVTITDSAFVRFVEDELGDYDFMVTKPPHNADRTLRDEYDYVMRGLKVERYLKVRYAEEDWSAEREAFKNALDAPIVNPRFFAYKESAKPLMDEWWRLIDEYTVFDQSQLSYLLHVGDYNYRTITWNELRRFCFIHGHKRLM